MDFSTFRLKIKPMNKTLLVLLFTPFLFGCDEESSPITDNSAMKFQIDETVFEVTLPTNWNTLSPESEAILLAQKGNENFVITQNETSAETFKQILENAKKELEYFEILSSSETKWQFKAKNSIHSPLREFHQKIITIPNTDFYLLGSCSFETAISTSTDCENILKNWKYSKE